jgi:regulator of replication initiation timing
METLQAEMNEKLSALVDEVRNLSENLKSVKRENEKLKETVKQQADEIADLRNENNDRELHARSWSIRVNNIALPPGQETDNRKVMMAVYSELVAPILAGAKEQGDINTVPSCDDLIEVAHILPGKNTKKPIIVRFFSRYWRSLLFKHRKDSAPREAANGDRPGRMRYPFYEDLTRATFKQLKTIQADERVTSAWTVSGTVRFKLENNDRIFKVTSIYDTVDDLIE